MPTEFPQKTNTKALDGVNNSLLSQQIMLPKNSNIQPFDYPDLTKDQKETTPLEKINFGDNYIGGAKQIAINAVRQLNAAYIADYSQERARLGEILGQSISGNMMSKLQNGIIQPASGVVARMGIDKLHSKLAEYNREVRSRLFRETVRVVTLGEDGQLVTMTGLSAGDECLDYVDENENETDELKALTPKTLDDIIASLSNDFLDPAKTYYLNVPVAALSTIGEVSEYVGENIVFAVSKVPGGTYVLEAIGEYVGKVIDTTTSTIGSGAKLVLNEEQLSTIVKEYQDLPSGIKVLANDIAIGMPTLGAGKLVNTAVKMTKKLKVGTSGVRKITEHNLDKKPINANDNKLSAKQPVKKLNNYPPRNRVQERLGGYYEGLSLEEKQLQMKAEDSLFAHKFGINSKAPNYQTVIERNTGITRPELSKHDQKYLSNLQGFDSWGELPTYLEKVPKKFGEPKYNQSGAGFRWQMKDEHGTHNIRIDKGDASLQNPGQKVDHVIVSYDGKIVDNTGKNYIMYDQKTGSVYKVERSKGGSEKIGIEHGFDIRKDLTETAKHPDAHIPAELWQKWKDFHKPD